MSVVAILKRCVHLILGLKLHLNARIDLILIYLLAAFAFQINVLRLRDLLLVRHF